MFDSVGRFFLTASAGLWMGVLLHLAFAVAPLNFKFAEEWNVSATSPMSNEIVESRTYAGYLTANTIKNTSTLQFWMFITATLGLALLWFPKQNRSILLLTKTLCLFTMGLLLWISELWVGAPMYEMLTNGTMESAISNGANEVRSRFNELHTLYSGLVSGIFLSGITLLLLIAFRPFEHRGKNI